MRLSEISPVYQEMLAVRAIIQNAFAVSADDLYVAHYPTADGSCFVLQVVAMQDHKPYAIEVAEVETDAQTFEREWQDVVAIHNAAPHTERVANTERSRVRRAAPLLIEKMLRAGFRSRRQ